jgi:flagellar protein FlgJ
MALPPSMIGAAGAAAASDALGFSGLNRLAVAAQSAPGNAQTIKAVSQQFEALLLQRMLSTMEATKLGPDLLGDTGGPMFQSMMNQQLATTIAQGHGVGMASFLARELAQRYGAKAAGADAALARSATTDKAAPSHATYAVPPRTTLGAAAAAAAPPPPATSTATTTPQTPEAVSGSHAAAGGGDDSLTQRARRFVASILPSVREAAAQLQVSPVALLAQAALETGWGNHAPGHNLFGVKAGTSWSGERFDTLTREVRNGVAQFESAAFRSYRSAADSVRNYAEVLLGSSRYQQARGRGDDIAGFASALQRAGYATDPNYATKLVAVAQGPVMRDALTALGLQP